MGGGHYQNPVGGKGAENGSTEKPMLRRSFLAIQVLWLHLLLLLHDTIPGVCGFLSPGGRFHRQIDGLSPPNRISNLVGDRQTPQSSSAVYFRVTHLNVP
jgi:hypothetical protein